MQKSSSIAFRIRQSWGVVAICAVVACLPVTLSGEIVLTDVTDQTGITFEHSNGGDGELYIVEYISGGVALFDYDRDDDVDIYFLNGAARSKTPGDPAKFKQCANALYRNDGNLKFTEVTDVAGVGDEGHSLGVAVGDFDRDGDPDFYVNNYGENRLYRNNGNGAFHEISKAAGVANGNKVGAGVCFLDYDADGDLDLYVANYVQFAYDKHVSRTRQGYRTFASPRDYQPEPDSLFRNNGDGTFTDVSKTTGIGSKSGPGMGSVCADYDRDGDTDIFVANDVHANFLFKNDGQGRFREVGLFSGFAYDQRGTVHGSMGVDCGDYDNDGQLDFHVTSYQNEFATLYRNGRNHILMDITSATGIGPGTRSQVTWGNAFVDLDNDADQDVFVACGHLGPNVEKYDGQAVFRAKNLLFENLGQKKFRNVSDSSGSGLAVEASSRGLAFDDLDGDGDLDAVVLNMSGRPTILRNDTRTENQWIGFQLRGKKSNPDGIGAQVEFSLGDRICVQEVHSGRGYQSDYGRYLHFGLGDAKQVDKITVRWIGAGAKTVTGPFSAGKVHSIEE